MPPITRARARARREKNPKSLLKRLLPPPTRNPRTQNLGTRNPWTPPPRTKNQQRKNRIDLSALEFQRLQVIPERRPQLPVLQRNLHRGLQKPKLVARVVRDSFIDVRPQTMFLRQNPQPVG